MPARRTRLDRGIYQDAIGVEVVVQRHQRRASKRFAPGTPLKVLQAWRDDKARQLARTAPAATRGTLARDIVTYLRKVGDLRSVATLRCHLKAWLALGYGRRTRWSLTAADIRQARTLWRAAGVRPKTVNNRVHALRALYHLLDGRAAPTPMDEVEALAPETPPIRWVQPETIRQVYLALLAGEQAGVLRTAKTRARFMVLASCGVRPAELMRACPGDVDVARRIWRVRTAKGGFRPGGLYLVDDMVAAWEVFIAADAWGPYETSAFARTLRAAGWPAGVRPYNLRHSLGVDLSEAGVDLADVSAVLGHTRPLTTRTHYVPVLGGRLREAVEAINGRISWPTGDAAVVVPRGRPRKALMA